jgi:hypothetical protein
MVKNMGHIWDGNEKWFITNVQVRDDVSSGLNAKLTIYLPRSINNPKVITKDITIYSNTAMWKIVEDLQRRYPHAVYWKTQKQRNNLHYGKR